MSRNRASSLWRNVRLKRPRRVGSGSEKLRCAGKLRQTVASPVLTRDGKAAAFLRPLLSGLRETAARIPFNLDLTLRTKVGRMNKHLLATGRDWISKMAFLQIIRRGETHVYVVLRHLIWQMRPTEVNQTFSTLVRYCAAFPQNRFPSFFTEIYSEVNKYGRLHRGPRVSVFPTDARLCINVAHTYVAALNARRVRSKWMTMQKKPLLHIWENSGRWARRNDLK